MEVTNFGYHSVPGKFEMTVRLTRILFPFILFVSLAAAVMGMLNASFVFGIPASASTVFNIVSVIAGVSLALAFDPAARATWPHPHFTERALYGVSLGVLAGRAGAAGRAASLAVPAGFPLSLAVQPPRPASGSTLAVDVAQRDRRFGGSG